MIDREWLSSLRFEAVSGGKVVKTKLGAEKAVFFVEKENEEGYVLKTYKNHLGYHIREVPPMLTKDRIYDVDKLNEKLEQMVGNPFYDVMPHDYDRLHSLVTSLLFKHGISGVVASLFSPESVETIPFILNSPGITRRIHEIEQMTSSNAIKEDQPIRINGPNFPIDLWPGVTQWEGVNLETLSPPPDYKPQTLHENPLFIWGGAILDGFFTDEELLHATEFVQSKFGPIASRPDVLVLISQMDAIASLLAQYFDNVKLERLVKFCAYCGVVFDVHDKNGNEVCNGARYL
jgi:hypothetical protein